MIYTKMHGKQTVVNTHKIDLNKKSNQNYNCVVNN